jgi:hypothetical protein
MTALFDLAAPGAERFNPISRTAAELMAQTWQDEKTGREADGRVVVIETEQPMKKIAAAAVGERFASRPTWTAVRCDQTIWKRTK